MLRSLFGRTDGQDGEREPREEGLQPDEQQEGGLQQPETQDGRFVQGFDDQVLRAIWDTGRAETAPGVAASDTASAGSSIATQVAQAAQAAQAGSSSRERQQADRAPTFESEETQEERRERQRLEGKENVAKRKRGEQRLDTIADAVEYCRELIAVQLERAKEQRAPMNEAIYGDAHARKAVTTLLPDQFIREIFLETTRSTDNLPRIRPLFGVPPYNFLRPEDAGLIRAGGIASGRTNMTYEKLNETASYSQFGAGHLVDGFFREYRIVTIREPQESDMLPCDLERIAPQKPVYLNVRVPKRSKEEKMTLLKDMAKRRAVLFPAVGEVLTVNYSSGLQAVWGSKANTRLDTKIVVKSMVPRSATGATAAVVAVKVS
jgi:hypothetical protein